MGVVALGSVPISLLSKEPEYDVWHFPAYVKKQPEANYLDIKVNMDYGFESVSIRDLDGNEMITNPTFDDMKSWNTPNTDIKIWGQKDLV